jgi:hypothetical protein
VMMASSNFQDDAISSPLASLNNAYIMQADDEAHRRRTYHQVYLPLPPDLAVMEPPALRQKMFGRYRSHLRGFVIFGPKPGIVIFHILIFIALIFLFFLQYDTNK